MCLWAAAFAFFKHWFAVPGISKHEIAKGWVDNQESLGCGKYSWPCLNKNNVYAMYDGVWVDLINMLLWLASTVLAATVLGLGWVRGTKVQH